LNSPILSTQKILSRANLIAVKQCEILAARSDHIQVLQKKKKKKSAGAKGAWQKAQAMRAADGAMFAVSSK
jgi:hypothetical protein